MIRHEHLKTAVEDYCMNGGKEILLRLANEFRYSSLYIASKRHDGKLVFDIYERDGVRLTALFTDLDEVAEFYDPGEVEVFSNSFELYRNLLKTSEIDGYILNPASLNYLLEKEFVLSISNMPKTAYVTSNPYSGEELKAMLECENTNLNDFIEKRHYLGNYEGLFERLSESVVLALMISDSDLSGLFENGILNMQLTGPLSSMYADTVGGRYAAIFSSKEKLLKVATSKFRYAQVINLSMLVNFVLSQDMDGIILNPSSDDILIARPVLLRYSLGFERYADDERLSDSMYYIFEI